MNVNLSDKLSDMQDAILGLNAALSLFGMSQEQSYLDALYLLKPLVEKQERIMDMIQAEIKKKS